MHDESQQAFYRDRYGRWQPDRRYRHDRRAHIVDDKPKEEDRRRAYRRKSDRERLERENTAF